MELIDKDAVVAEINKLKECFVNKRDDFEKGYHSSLNAVSTFIDTLEVKGVDLNESTRHYLLHEHLSPLNNILHKTDLKTELQYHTDIENAFKAGYKFGLKAQKGE